MFLKNLIKNLSKKNNKIKIKGLSINSKNIKRGYIFFLQLKETSSMGKSILMKLLEMERLLLYVQKNVNT